MDYDCREWMQTLTKRCTAYASSRAESLCAACRDGRGRRHACWQAEADSACGRAPEPLASSSPSSGSSAMVLLRQAVFCGVLTPTSASPAA